jgi:Flp pilus assembly protein TadG
MARIAKKSTRGVVTIEMAVALPLLLLLVLGVIEYGWMFLKNQGITNSARQTARIAARYDSTTADIQTALTNAITAAGLTGSGYTSSLAPDPTTLGAGETFSVTVAVPYTNIELIGVPFLPTPATLTSTVTMAKEGP